MPAIPPARPREGHSDALKMYMVLGVRLLVGSPGGILITLHGGGEINVGQLDIALFKKIHE